MTVSTIEKCTNKANIKVTGGMYAGGIIAGLIGGRKPVNSYSMNVSVTAGPDDVSSSTSAEDMKKQSTFDGFDFDNVWELTNGQYPTLK